ncbi:MAG: GNAT family N-acetyltransferase [Lachnospiraceae bacterium]|nr:GNAT family N-acetyltransferase [Lachnospiraceae bacterium]
MNDLIFSDKSWLLSEEAFSIYSHCMYHATYEDFKAQMDIYLSNPSIKVFVYENRDIKAAMMVLDTSGNTAEIIGIAVSDKFQHRGIGKQLIQNVMESENLESIKAQTDDDSIGFYRKCGFTDERVELKYPDGLAVRYNCVLRK